MNEDDRWRGYRFPTKHNNQTMIYEFDFVPSTSGSMRAPDQPFPRVPRNALVMVRVRQNENNVLETVDFTLPELNHGNPTREDYKSRACEEVRNEIDRL